MSMPICKPILKQLRLEAKLSQNKLARLADLDRTTVSKAENGVDVNELSVSKLSSALTKALGRTVKDSDLTMTVAAE
jgi:transcriptional regulator with XRE-family HTH domain